MNPFANLTDIVRKLLILNIIVYVMTTFLLSPVVGNLLAVYYPESPAFKPFQLLTYMFMHDSRNIGHIFFNMFALVSFGPPIETMFGARRFLIYYLACGFGALALQFGVDYYHLHYLVSSDEVREGIYATGTVGASGAIFGLLAAFGILFPNVQLMLLFPPIPLKAKYMVLIFGALELYLGFSGQQTGVAHWAHVGGAVTGALMLLYWRNGRLL
jgi:membrane associated rhomboid family serine protease